MNKRLVGIGLGLLTIALWIGPIAMAFQANGWSLKKTIMPDQEDLNAVQQKIQEAMGQAGFSPDMFQPVDNNLEGNTLSLTFQFQSPLDSEVKVKEIQLVLLKDGTEIVTLNMEEDQVVVSPGESEQILVSGELSEEGMALLSQGGAPTGGGFLGGSEMGENSYFEFEVKGITLKISLSAMQGGGGPGPSGGGKTRPSEGGEEKPMG